MRCAGWIIRLKRHGEMGRIAKLCLHRTRKHERVICVLESMRECVCVCVCLGGETVTVRLGHRCPVTLGRG